MSSASCDADANGVSSPRTHVALDPKECNGVINNAECTTMLMLVPVASYEQENHVAPYFYHFDLKM